MSRYSVKSTYVTVEINNNKKIIKKNIYSNSGGGKGVDLKVHICEWLGILFVHWFITSNSYIYIQVKIIVYRIHYGKYSLCTIFMVYSTYCIEHSLCTVFLV